MTEAAPIDGTLVACVGPAGCGKTYLAAWLALKCAHVHGLPFVGIDPAGDVTKYVEGFMEYAAETGDDETLSWLNDADCVRVLQLGDPREGLYTYDQAVTIVDELVAHFMARRVTEPQAVVFLDELAALREHHENTQNSTIPRGRNAGVFFWGTCQTPEGMTPKARACLRAMVAWKTTKGGAELFGRWVDNKHLTMPRSDKVCYVTPYETGVLTADMEREIPALFSTPVQPTQVKRRRL